MESAFRNRWLCAQARARMARPTSEDPFPEPFPELSIPMLSPYRRPFRACRSAPASQSIRWAQERTEDWAVTQEGNQPRFASTALATMSVPIGNDIARVRLTYRPDKRKAQDGFGLSLGRIAEWETWGDTDVAAPSLPTIATEPPRYSADWRRMASLSPATKKPRTVGGIDTIASVVYDVWDEVPPLVLPHKLALNLDYLQNISFSGDVALILKTLSAVFLRRSERPSHAGQVLGDPPVRQSGEAREGGILPGSAK